MAAKEVIDKEARNKAESSLKQTYLLDAGAGTGKTSVLVSRVLNILLNTSTTLDRIVVITFTEKAAGELKFRIREEIDKRLTDPVIRGDPDAQKTLAKAIADIEKAPISTIHSFCASLLRERPIEAGLTPNFVVADEFADSLLFDEGWEKWLERELSAEDSENEAVTSALTSELSLKDLKEIAKKIFDNRDFLEWIEKPKEDSSDTKKILWWLKGAVEYIEKVKKEKDIVDFQDLLLKTRDLLRKNKEVRGYFIDRYDYILVDEFQDTDPLQAEIVFFLAEEKPLADHWKNCKLKPGKLFIVGDPKQSIYGFRRADIEMYNEVKFLVEKHGKIEALKQNFRTVKNITDWVNKKFHKIIEKSEYQPSYIEIIPYRDDESQTENCTVWSLPVPLSEGQNNVDAIRKKEAEVVANFINHVVDNWDIWDKRNEKWRKLDYGDITLLFLRRTGLRFFEQAFKKHRIPFISVGATTFLATIEIADVINCLKAINKPADNIAVVGALRSLFFGFSDEEIFIARQKGLDFDYTKPMPEDENVAIFKDTYELLRELLEKRNKTKTSALIMELYEKTMAPAVYLGERGGEQRIANLMKVVEKARIFENAGAFTFGEFVNYLESQQTAVEGGEEEAAIWEPGDPFVRLMTIHAAKGLEFPMVVIADHTLEGEERDNKKWKIIFDRKSKTVELILKVDQKKARSAIEEKEESKKQAEINRLLYVACTRARDYLVLPYSHEKRGEGKFTYSLFAKGEQIREIKLDELKKKAPFYAKEAPPKPLKINYCEEEFEKWKNNKRQKLQSIIRPERFRSVTSLYKGEQVSFRASAAEEKRKIGSLVHALLEAIALEPLNKDNIGEIVKLLNSDDLIDEALKRVEDLVSKALDTPIMQRALKAQALQREYPIVMEEKGTIISGRVDLVFAEEDGIVIVDYKTDEVSDREEAEQKVRDTYIIQGEFYSKIIQKAAQTLIKEVYFLFLSPSPPIAVNILQL